MIRSFKIYEEENRYGDKLAKVYTYDDYNEYVRRVMSKKGYKLILWRNCKSSVTREIEGQDFDTIMVFVNEIDGGTDSDRLKKIIGFNRCGNYYGGDRNKNKIKTNK